MKRSTLNSSIQSALLFGLMFSLASLSEANEQTGGDAVSQRLASHFDAAQDYRYLDYERVEHAHADEYGNMSYFVMDFDAHLAWAHLQDSIHQICSKVLADRGLIKTLSDQGYDMVSVSFDRESQYDCL